MELLSKAELVSQRLESGLSAHRSRVDRWKQCREFCYGEGNPTPAFEGAPAIRFPIVPQMVDALGSVVVDSMTSVDPYCFCILHDDEEGQGEISRAVQYFFERGRLKKHLKNVSKAAAWANCGWIKALWDEGKFVFRVLEPDSTVVYPARAECLEDARLFGSRKFMRRKQIDDNEDYKVTSELTPSNPVNENGVNSVPVNREDDEIELWELYYFDGKWERITVARESKQIIWTGEVSEGELKHCFAEFSYKPKPSPDGYYSHNSVVSDLGDFQIAADNTFNAFFAATFMNALGVFFTQGGVEGAKQVGSITPGGVYELNTESLVPHNPQANTKDLLPLLMLILEQARKTGRISEFATGQSPVGVDTATEANFVNAGTARSIDEYQQNFAEGLVQLARYVQYVLYANWDEWKPTRELLGISEESKDVFGKDALWRVSVTSVSGTPSQKLQTTMAVSQMAQNPESRFDLGKIEERIATLLEQSGFTDAEGLLKTQDPTKLVMELAEGFGIEPEILLPAVMSAINAQQQAISTRMDGLETAQMLSDVPGEGLVPSAGDAAQSLGMQAGEGGGP